MKSLTPQNIIKGKSSSHQLVKLSQEIISLICLRFAGLVLPCLDGLGRPVEVWGSYHIEASSFRSTPMSVEGYPEFWLGSLHRLLELIEVSYL